MTSTSKKPGEFVIKAKADPRVADHKQASLGGGKKPLKVKLDQSRDTLDAKQVRLGGGKKPFDVKLNQSRNTLDKKQARIGGGRAPLNR